MAAHDDELYVALTRIALAGDGVVLGIGMTVLALRTWFKYRSHAKALKDVEETPLSRIADLRSLVDGSSEDLTRTSLHESNKEVSMKHDALVMVRGKVQSKASVESKDKNHDTGALTAQNVDEKAVYLERTQTCLYNEWRGIFGWSYEWRAILGWGSRKEQVTVSRRKVPFVLAERDGEWDQKLGKLAVYVHINIEDAKHPVPLVTVYHQLHPVPSSSYTFLQAMFGRRYLVGLLDEEKILPIGREITAVGTLDMSLDGYPVIKPSGCLPIFLTDLTREQLLLDLANGRIVLFWMGIAVTTVAVGVLGYALIKNWTKWKERQQQRQQPDEGSRHVPGGPFIISLLSSVENDDVEDMADIPDGELCVVCLLRRRRAAFIHCGHRVCCVGCAQHVEQGDNPRCPVCRQTVTGIVRVFDS
ncbi:unnamed protein product [Sphagnum jensenii]|uniref:RING-type E3 ubiquitin transferase n=1 Tax=Sphagnum jensenii TaxID=128206 RepID=A0ABP0VMB2_9BRYO